MERFRNLAANERTYLAWIRTAIGIMAFGFLIEKFELFFQMFADKVEPSKHFIASTAVESVGIAMMFVAVLIIITATVRYIIQKIHILQDREVKAASVVISGVLAVFLVVVALLLIVYVAIRILPVI